MPLDFHEGSRRILLVAQLAWFVFCAGAAWVEWTKGDSGARYPYAYRLPEPTAAPINHEEFSFEEAQGKRITPAPRGEQIEANNPFADLIHLKGRWVTRCYNDRTAKGWYSTASGAEVTIQFCFPGGRVEVYGNTGA
jgi:hypothetical protein